MATRLLPPFYQVVDANGRPYAGAKLYTYAAGTSTPMATYADAGLTIANTNPVIADAAGRFGDIFIGSVEYHVTLKDANDATIDDADPVGLNVGGAERTLLFAGTLTGAYIDVPLLGATNVEFHIARGDLNADSFVGVAPRSNGGAAAVTFDITYSPVGGASTSYAGLSGIGLNYLTVLSGLGSLYVEGSLAVPASGSSGRLEGQTFATHVTTGPVWRSDLVGFGTSSAVFNIDTLRFAPVPPATLFTGDGRLIVLARN